MKSFEEFILESEKSSDKFLTVGDLKRKLKWLQENQGITDEHVLCFHPVGEDEGDVSALVPIQNLSSGLTLLKEDGEMLKKILSKEGPDIVFLSQETYNV